MLAGFGSYSPNSSRLQDLENVEIKVAYFASISSTSGTIVPPTGATILLDQIAAGADAYITTISSGEPTGNPVLTSTDTQVVVSSFDSGGNYTLSGTPSSTPIALIYFFTIPLSSYSNLDPDYIIEENLWYGVSQDEYTIIATPFDQISKSSTELANISGTNNFDGSGFTQRRLAVMTHDGIFSYPRVILSSTQPASGSLVLTLYKNGSATSIVVTINASDPGGVTPYVDSVHNVKFVEGDYFYWSATNNATSNSAVVACITLNCKILK